MKLLIIGIDGGDLEIMKSFKMPFMHEYIRSNHSLTLTEDLFNRGWVEILTGEEGKNTGGFYMSPVLDGSHRFSTSFSMKQLENKPGITPLWKLAEKKGANYCIMNVPTTTPVPKTTNGIVIGSAGGGLNKIEGIPTNLVSDEETRKFLENKGYVVDIRIPNDEIEDTVDLFDKLREMEDLRTECFIDICKTRACDFGFLANRGTTIAQYMARSEIDSHRALETMNEFMPKGGEKSWAHKLLEEHYMALDENIRKMHDELKPEYLIITADHNTVPHKYRASVTPFLLEQGYLKSKGTGARSTISNLKKILQKVGLSSKIGKVTKKLSPQMRDILKTYDWRKSEAFGSEYVNGIYINDQERFGGPISKDSINPLVDKICDDFNSLSEDSRKGMIAIPYRRNVTDGRFVDSLPDITFQGSEGIFFLNDGKSLTWENPNYGPIPEKVGEVNHAAFSGDKGRNPICVMSQSAYQKCSDNDSSNLTLIYKLAERIL